jgi:hypothetical protein
MKKYSTSSCLREDCIPTGFEMSSALHKLNNRKPSNLQTCKSIIMYSQLTSPYCLPKGFIPTATDILCGRGKANEKFHGNIVFMTVIRSSLKAYTDAGSRIEKSAVVTSVVSNLFDAGMRFLKYDGRHNQFMELSSVCAHDKVSHAIRDLIKHKTKKNNSGKSKSARLASRDTIAPEVVHSIGESFATKRAQEQNNTGRKRTLSSCFAKQQQLPNSIFSISDNVLIGKIDESRAEELEEIISGLNENMIYPGAKGEEDFSALLTEDILSMEFLDSSSIPKQHNKNAALLSPLPLDSKLDFEYLDIETLRVSLTLVSCNECTY